ncbi:hypothetical protein HMPREF9123_2004 [Neisseria bacilliformis ATCC BAA-1200]|uniref:Uncharacterized protein n=1 Tax=Neisseria bacilliformis ATCC BAA-1200 TaxID=888742 RepID=F2BE48_9NEIS|nr:hypothetical protein HMPREF9123_2004 [Neisseria bacilliformis ATCC BAA-1200]
MPKRPSENPVFARTTQTVQAECRRRACMFVKRKSPIEVFGSPSGCRFLRPSEKRMGRQEMPACALFHAIPANNP